MADTIKNVLLQINSKFNDAELKRASAAISDLDNQLKEVNATFKGMGAAGQLMTNFASKVAESEKRISNETRASNEASKEQIRLLKQTSTAMGGVVSNENLIRKVTRKTPRTKTETLTYQSEGTKVAVTTGRRGQVVTTEDKTFATRQERINNLRLAAQAKYNNEIKALEQKQFADADSYYNARELLEKKYNARMERLKQKATNTIRNQREEERREAEKQKAQLFSKRESAISKDKEKTAAKQALALSKETEQGQASVNKLVQQEEAARTGLMAKLREEYNQKQKIQNLQSRIKEVRGTPGVVQLPSAPYYDAKNQVQYVKQFFNPATRALHRFDEAAGIAKVGILSTTQAAQIMGTEVKRTGDTIQSAASKVLLWTIATGSIFTTIRAMKSAISAFSDAERMSIALQRVGRGFSTATEPLERSAQIRSGAEQLRRTIMDLRIEYGTTADEASDAAIVFARLGFTQRETAQATAVAMKAANVANIGAADAAKYLASSMVQFGMSVQELPTILDHLNTLENTTRVRTEDLFQSISRAGAVFREAGGSMEELAAITAVVSESSGRSGAEIGNAFKTIASRIGSMATHKNVMEQTGIAIRNQAGDIKDILPLLSELYVKWDDLTEVQQAETTQALAGVRQKNILQNTLNNLGQVYEQIIRQYREAGSASAENDLVLSTLSKKVEQATAAFQTFGVELGSAGVGSALKIVVDSMRYLFQFLSKLGYGLIPLTTLFGGFVLKMGMGAVEGSKLKNTFVGLGTGFNTAKAAVAAMNKSIVDLGTALVSMNTKTIASSAVVVGLKNTIKGLITTIVSLGRFLLTTPIGLLITALSAASYAWYKYKEAQNAALNASIEAYEKSNKEYNEMVSKQKAVVTEIELLNMALNVQIKYENDLAAGIQVTNEQQVKRLSLLKAIAGISGGGLDKGDVEKRTQQIFIERLKEEAHRARMENGRGYDASQSRFFEDAPTQEERIKARQQLYLERAKDVGSEDIISRREALKSELELLAKQTDQTYQQRSAYRMAVIDEETLALERTKGEKERSEIKARIAKLWDEEVTDAKELLDIMNTITDAERALESVRESYAQSVNSVTDAFELQRNLQTSFTDGAVKASIEYKSLGMELEHLNMRYKSLSEKMVPVKKRAEAGDASAKDELKQLENIRENYGQKILAIEKERIFKSRDIEIETIKETMEKAYNIRKTALEREIINAQKANNSIEGDYERSTADVQTEINTIKKRIALRLEEGKKEQNLASTREESRAIEQDFYKFKEEGEKRISELTTELAKKEFDNDRKIGDDKKKRERDIKDSILKSRIDLAKDVASENVPDYFKPIAEAQAEKATIQSALGSGLITNAEQRLSLEQRLAEIQATSGERYKKSMFDATLEMKKQTEELNKQLGQMSDEDLLRTQIIVGRMQRGEIAPGSVDLTQQTEEIRKFLTSSDIYKGILGQNPLGNMQSVYQMQWNVPQAATQTMNIMMNDKWQAAFDKWGQTLNVQVAERVNALAESLLSKASAPSVKPSPAPVRR